MGGQATGKPPKTWNFYLKFIDWFLFIRCMIDWLIDGWAIDWLLLIRYLIDWLIDGWMDGLLVDYYCPGTWFSSTTAWPSTSSTMTSGKFFRHTHPFSFLYFWGYRLKDNWFVWGWSATRHPLGGRGLVGGEVLLKCIHRKIFALLHWKIFLCKLFKKLTQKARFWPCFTSHGITAGPTHTKLAAQKCAL